jgi:diacylglycerol kinase family enzyme
MKVIEQGTSCRERVIEVIINAGSGPTADDGRDRVAELLVGTGVEVRMSVARTGADLLKLARRAVQGDAATIVAGGGDGTICAVASTVVGTGKMLGVLPLGTLNHFAKDLKIPLDLSEAVETIVAGHAVRVDVGEVNDRIFLNNSSLGLYPRVVYHREQKQRLGHRKWPAFIWAIFSVLRRYPFVHVRLKIDGKNVSSRTPFVFIGNNEYEMESFNIGSRARLDGGELSLYFSHRTGRLGLLKLGLRALTKRLSQAKEFVAMRTSEIWIETRRGSVHVSIDGEVVLMQSPLHYKIRPRELLVIVPSGDTALTD